MTNVKDKVIFLTGANRGIGKALLIELLEQGAKKVYAAVRNPSQIETIEDDRIIKVELDITEAKQRAQAVVMAGDTQILINNAGVASFIGAFDGPMDQVERDMKVNYLGTLEMMRDFIPVLEQNTPASIVNVVSIAAFVNFPFLGGYCASKAALYSVTQGARLELASKGITVHSVNPGPIDTDMGAGVDMDKTSPQDTAKGILEGMKAGEPDIFPDPIGREMFKTWSKDYRDLEASVAESMKQDEAA